MNNTQLTKTQISEKFQPYIVNQYTLDETSPELIEIFENSDEESRKKINTPIFVVEIKMKEILEKELGYYDITINEVPHILHRIQLIMQTVILIEIHEKSETISIYFQNDKALFNLLSKIKQFGERYHNLIMKITFLSNYHPDKFLCQITQTQRPFERMNYETLQQKIQQFKLGTSTKLSHHNIDLSLISIDEQQVVEFLNRYIVRQVGKEIEVIEYFQHNGFFKTPDNVNFQLLDNPEKNLYNIVSHLVHNQWDKLGEEKFKESIISQLFLFKNTQNNIQISFNDFMNHNTSFFLEYEKELRVKIFSSFKTKTVLDVIENNPLFNDRYLFFQYLKHNVFNNDEIMKQSKAFSLLVKEHEFIKYQQTEYIFIKKKFGNLGVTNFKELGELPLKNFIESFDRSLEQQCLLRYHTVVTKEEDINTYIGSFWVGEGNEKGFGEHQLNYLSIINSYGGMFLILFDLYSIKEKGLKEYKLYKNVFSHSKQQILNFKQRVLLHLFYFINFLFDGELKKDEKELVDLCVFDVFNSSPDEKEQLLEFYDKLSCFEGYLHFIKPLLEKGETT